MGGDGIISEDGASGDSVPGCAVSGGCASGGCASAGYTSEGGASGCAVLESIAADCSSLSFALLLLVL